MSILELFNNRELATISLLFFILICIFMICLKIQGIKDSALNAIKAFLNKNIVISLIISFIYLLIIIYIINLFIILDVLLIKIIVLWWLTLGNYSIFKFIFITVDEDLYLNIKNILLNPISLGAIVLFISSQYSFSFIIEFILIVFIGFISTMYGYGIHHEENSYNKKLNKVLKSILIWINIVIFIYAIYSLLKDYKQLSSIELIISFFLPLILNILWLPLLYIFLIYALYERVFIVIDTHIKSDLQKQTKFFMIQKCKLNFLSLFRVHKHIRKEFYTGLELQQIKDTILLMKKDSRKLYEEIL